jgi:alkanesulfonate monooxygenase SsuD/methylene tetrahydromethanopterin reductase-like flavin-dependent oxidoreductase (luciferase family)
MRFIGWTLLHFCQSGGFMKFGMFLPSSGPLATGPGAADALVTIAQKAEAVGFDSLWVADHVVIPTTIKSRYPYNDSGRFPIPAEAGFLEPLRQRQAATLRALRL